MKLMVSTSSDSFCNSKTILLVIIYLRKAANINYLVLINIFLQDCYDLLKKKVERFFPLRLQIQIVKILISTPTRQNPFTPFYY